MKETITIENFGGIKNAVIPLNSINIFIGRQASGKSVTAKLLYFFKGIVADIFAGADEEKDKRQIDSKILNKFSNYFPSEVWTDCNFLLKYEIGNESISVEKDDKKKPTLNYTPKIKKLFSIAKELKKKELNEILQSGSRRTTTSSIFQYYDSVRQLIGEDVSKNQIFVPAGRSFFANLENNIFSFLSTNRAIDPFLVEFGSFYESMKGFISRPLLGRNKNENKETDELVDKLIAEILVGKYLREDKKDFIVHDDDRKISVSFSSSGQQETLPLLIVLKMLTSIGFVQRGATLYIEEPEAHLFPSAQKKIVELISAIFNSTNNTLQVVITTHSPYILTSFNNLLQAGHLEKIGANKRKLHKIVPSAEILKPNELNAYMMKDGKCSSLIDENGLIEADLLDEVSEEIATQFDSLLSI